MLRSVIIFSALFCSCIGNQSKEDRNKDSSFQIKIDQNKTALKKNDHSLDSVFLEYWLGFVDVVKNSNMTFFNERSLDSIENNGKTISLNEFNGSYFRKVFDSVLRSRLDDATKINFSDFEVDSDALQKYNWTKVKLTNSVIKQAAITKSEKDPEGQVIVVLEFVKTERGYKFCGWKEFGSGSTGIK
ncbi:MAG: hypothetical protein J0H07_16940 [Sphingobacteriales bacterium]|nr:hypothetical protein [Sphingobacteriales bacterium]